MLLWYNEDNNSIFFIRLIQILNELETQVLTHLKLAQVVSQYMSIPIINSVTPLHSVSWVALPAAPAAFPLHLGCSFTCTGITSSPEDATEQGLGHFSNPSAEHQGPLQ